MLSVAPVLAELTWEGIMQSAGNSQLGFFLGGTLGSEWWEHQPWGQDLSVPVLRLPPVRSVTASELPHHTFPLVSLV